MPIKHDQQHDKEFLSEQMFPVKLFLHMHSLEIEEHTDKNGSLDQYNHTKYVSKFLLVCLQGRILLSLMMKKRMFLLLAAQLMHVVPNYN